MLKLIFRFLWRFIRDGELTLLLASLVIAASTVTGISLFVSRIDNTVMHEAASFLAADAQVYGTVPVSQNIIDIAKSNNFTLGESRGFRSMAFAGEDMQLSDVKAVSENYPLRGTVQLSDTPFGETFAVHKGPEIGEAWLSSRLFSALNIRVGDNVTIGKLSLTVSAALIREPDAGQNGFGFSPRIIMNIDDVAATETIQVGSRINYTLLLAGNEENLEEFHQSIIEDLGKHLHWRTAKESNESLGDALDRAERFLLLAGSLSVILAGVAVALAAHRFAKKQRSNVALLKSFGLRPQEIAKLYLGLTVVIGVIGMALGILLGLALQEGLIFALGDLIPSNLAAPSGFSFIIGGLTASLSLLAFCVPPFWALRNVAPSQIFRNPETAHSGAWQSVVFGTIAIIALVYSYSLDISITLIAALALALISLLGSLVIRASLALVAHAGKNLRGALKLGFSNLDRQRFLSVLQIFVFSMVFLLLLVLTQIRTGMLDQWQDQLPKDTPNYFAFNIFVEDLNALQNAFDSNDIKPKPIYPMMRGRMTHANDLTLADIPRAENANADYKRELNFTWTTTLGEDNKITQGEWWDKDNSDSSDSDNSDLNGSAIDNSLIASPAINNLDMQVSVEEEYARGLNLVIGDTLKFSVGGRTFEATLTNIRSVEWNSMNPNFFMIFNQDFTAGAGTSWVTSFYLDEDRRDVISGIARQFPNISMLELGQTFAQIQEIIAKISLAIEFILILVLSAACIVMLTSIQATLDERRRESALLRSFGASRGFVRKVLSIEFLLIGSFAGIISVIGAETCLYFIEERLFKLEYHLHYWMWPTAPLASALLVSLVGSISTLKIVRTAPLKILRQN
ncbi:MAG: putative ABC transport system permease protein [Flavobacteriales bacterium]|jgi:putative ABC transport system permease protein